MIRVIIFVILVAVLWTLFTQVVLPSWNNKKIFPMFRSDLRKLNEQAKEFRTKQDVIKAETAALHEELQAMKMEKETSELEKNLQQEEM